MHVRSNGTALLGLMLLGFQLSATAAGAQAVDSTHRWSLYGGTVPTEGYGHASVSNLELGAAWISGRVSFHSHFARTSRSGN